MARILVADGRHPGMLNKLFRSFDGNLPDEIDRIEDRGDIQIVRFKGVLDKNTLPDDSVWVNAYIEENRIFDKNILVDFKKVKKVDSAAVAACLMRLRQFEEHGRKIALINVPKDFLRLLEIEKIADQFLICRSEKAAMAALKK